MSETTYKREMGTLRHAVVVLSWLLLPVLGNLASCLVLAVFVEAFAHGSLPSFGVPKAFRGLAILGTGTALLVLPWLSAWAYRTRIARRYGTCTLKGARASFSPAVGRDSSLPVGCLLERQVTPYGLRVRHPVLKTWLLIPTDGTEAAGRVAAELDERAHSTRKDVAPRGVGELPDGTRLTLEREPKRVRLAWKGGSLVLTPGELHLPRSRLGGAEQHFTPRELPFVYRGNQATVWAIYVGGSRLLAAPDAIGVADAVWLQALLQAWQQGVLDLSG